MPRKRTGYDAACYYDGKLLGRCTKADSDAYTLLMNACGGEAARVLREYAYFSPELKAILEKAALMQADRSRTGGMFHAPKSSPWGEVSPQRPKNAASRTRAISAMRRTHRKA